MRAEDNNFNRREFYKKPNIKSAIMEFAKYSKDNIIFSKALNHDYIGWYSSHGDYKGMYQGNNPDAYDKVIKKADKTVYLTLNYFRNDYEPFHKYLENSIWKKVDSWKECYAYMLSVDIDILKPYSIHDPIAKEALEEAVKYTHNKLSALSSAKLISLFSGNGAYIHLHPGFGYFSLDMKPEKRAKAFEILIKAFNNYLFEIENSFYKEHPEYKPQVGSDKDDYPKYEPYIKLDRINNRNRLIKAPLSIHKKYDYVVYPIPESWKLPLIKYQNLSDDEITIASEQLKSFRNDEPNGVEIEQFNNIIDPYLKDANNEIVDNILYTAPKPQRPEDSYDIELITSEPVVKAIFDIEEWEDGNIRRITLMASYLAASGWERSEVQSWIKNHVSGWKRIPDDLERRIDYGYDMYPPGFSRIYSDGSFPSVGLNDIIDHLPRRPNNYSNPMTFIAQQHYYRRQTEKTRGEYTINTVSMDYPTEHLPMFRKLQDIVGIHSRSHKHVLKMIYYTMVSTINAGTVVYINNARHDLRISTIFVGKQGQGKTEILNTTAETLEGVGMTVHRPTSFHPEQWIGKTKPDKKAENGVSKIMGYLKDDVIIIDEAKRLISDPDFAEVRKNARISQNRYLTSPVEKKNVDTENHDKIKYHSKSVLIYGVQDMKMDAEDFIIEGDIRRYAVSVLDNETMDPQEDIIRSVMENERELSSSEIFAEYLNKIPRLPEEVFIKLGTEERILYERATINLNARANSYSKMVSEYFGTLGAEYLTLFLKFVVNYALIRMTEAGIKSQDLEITREDIIFAYVDCFEMLEHRYEWTHFYLVTESALVHKGAKYAKEIKVLSKFNIGAQVKKGVLNDKIQEVYGVKERQARNTLQKFIENGFITEINKQNVKIKKLPGHRVKRQDDLAVKMYEYALNEIKNIEFANSKAHPTSLEDFLNVVGDKTQSEVINEDD